jgi:hypothetical protein
MAGPNETSAIVREVVLHDRPNDNIDVKGLATLRIVGPRSRLVFPALMVAWMGNA